MLAPECDVRAHIKERGLTVPVHTGVLNVPLPSHNHTRCTHCVAVAQPTKNDKPIPYIHVKDVIEVIRSNTIARYKNGKLVWWPMQDRHSIDIVIGIDKGGSSTKLQIVWLNSLQPQSSLSSMCIGMYEGPEDYEQMSECYRELLSQLLTTSFVLEAENDALTNDFGAHVFHKCPSCATPIKPIRPKSIHINNINVVYNGDTTAVNKALGSRGHTSSHPCPCCLVPSSALAYYAKQVHCLGELPSAAVPPWRTTEQHDSSHDSFIHEGKGDKKRAKEHKNAILPSLFATEIACRIVPPVLHIVTGIALNLLTHIEEQCGEYDKQAAQNGNAGMPFTSLLQATVAQYSVWKRPAYGELSGEVAHRFLHNAQDFGAFYYHKDMVEW